MKIINQNENFRRRRLYFLEQLISIHDNVHRTNYGQVIYSLEDHEGILLVKAEKDDINIEDIEDFERSVTTCWAFLYEYAVSFEYITLA